MSSSDHIDALVGRVVADRYEVVRKLSEGGVGAVYLAIQRPLDRAVALKVLLKKHADDPTAIRRFEKEAAAVARLAHAHIVTLYDFGTTPAGDLYIAMELLRGQNVRELLDAAGYITWERALHIIIGVTRALVAAHTQKIVHRDLKPENVMLVESNGDLDFAKVLDFGLARSIQGTAGPQITRHDVIPGTPAYMSPERANGISDDPRSDLYALGAMWFELLVGEPPFPGETSIKVILRHVHEIPRRLAVAQPNNPVPGFIEGLITRLLEKSPDARPASARALLDELEAISRPAGWHVGRTADVGRRGDHDDELKAFSVAAATLVEDDDFNFAVELGSPTPLVRRKPNPPQQAREQPVLLTKKKATPAHGLSQSMSMSSSLASLMDSATAAMPAPTPTAVTAAAAPSMPRVHDDERPPPPHTPSRGHSTEDFLRNPSAMAPPTGAGPIHLAPPRSPPRIESVAQVAGWLSTAKTVREVAELCCAFLATRFDRVLVIDLRAAVPVTLAHANIGGKNGPALPAIVSAITATPAVTALAGRREAYYGPAMIGPDWLGWFGALGGSVPGAMFVGGLGREGKAAFFFYADHREITLRPMVKDTVVLLREAAAALSAIG